MATRRLHPGRPALNRALAGLALSLMALTAAAQTSQLVVQRTALAGYRYHAAPELWPQLQEGDTLSLVRETDNAFDAQAVRIDWHGQPLGYLPRELNGAIARALDRSEPLTARIYRLRDAANPRLRVEIEITTALTPQPSY